MTAVADELGVVSSPWSPLPGSLSTTTVSSMRPLPSRNGSTGSRPGGKPSREEAPSNLTVVGRYVLPPEIFDCLEQDSPRRQGRNPIDRRPAAVAGQPKPVCLRVLGQTLRRRHPLGLLQASLEFALARDDTPRSRPCHFGRRPTACRREVMTPMSDAITAHVANLHAARTQLLELLDGMDYCLDWKLEPSDWSARQVVYHLLESPPGGPPKSPLGRCLRGRRRHRGLGGRRQHHPGQGELRPGTSPGRHRQVRHRHGGSPRSRRRAGIAWKVSAGPPSDQRRRPGLPPSAGSSTACSAPTGRNTWTKSEPCAMPWACDPRE